MMVVVTMCWQTPHPIGSHPLRLASYVLAGMHIHASCRAPAPAGRCRPSYTYYDATLCAHGPCTRAKTCVCLVEAAIYARSLVRHWLQCCCVLWDTPCGRSYPPPLPLAPPPPLFPTPFPCSSLPSVSPFEPFQSISCFSRYSPNTAASARLRKRLLLLHQAAGAALEAVTRVSATRVYKRCWR